MEILIVRHAHPEEYDDWKREGKAEGLRPLTKRGIHRFAESVKGLSRLVSKVDCVYSSYYTRAVQTMEILHGSYKGSDSKIIESLNPGIETEDLKRILSSHKENDVICFVGHYPGVGQLCSSLVSKSSNMRIRFKKGSIASIQYENGTGELQWLMNQKQLTALAQSDKVRVLENLI